MAKSPKYITSRKAPASGPSRAKHNQAKATAKAKESKHGVGTPRSAKHGKAPDPKC